MQFAYSRRVVKRAGARSAIGRATMAVLSLLPRRPLFGLSTGTFGRVSTGNGLQPLLEFALILCRASRPSRFYEALALALRLLSRCLSHVLSSEPCGLRSLCR